MGIVADLHSHSAVSDGWYRPGRVVDIQATRGAALVALTDHDTFDGVSAARVRAAEHGLGYLVGIEVSASPPWRMNHLLAHGPRMDDPGLRALLEANRLIWRAEALAAQRHLRAAGLPVPDASRYDDPALLVMPHAVARDAIRVGRVRHAEVWAAIRRALSQVPAHVYARMPGPREVADSVHAAGGLVVWAHPGQSQDSDLMRAAVASFDAIEVYTPRHTESVVAELEAFCRDAGKPRTTGSDFHGHPRYERPAVSLDPAYLELLADRVAWPQQPAGAAG